MPLCPFPDVLPLPDPGPRPMRFRLRCEPGAGVRLCKPIFSNAFSFFATVPPLLLDGRHLDEVAYLLDLSEQAGRDRFDHHVLMMPQSHRGKSCTHPPRVADAAAHLRDPHLSLLGKVQLLSLLRPACAVPDECPRHQTASFTRARER